ncbi:hypothetical protein GQ600_13598 [Phytophthora cactorum]|nr:hypothetical protein GQ600_13598 [Phytophthora cactorum]
MSIHVSTQEEEECCGVRTTKSGFNFSGHDYSSAHVSHHSDGRQGIQPRKSCVIQGRIFACLLRGRMCRCARTAQVSLLQMKTSCMDVCSGAYITYTSRPKTKLLSTHTCTFATGWTTLPRRQGINSGRWFRAPSTKLHQQEGSLDKRRSYRP